MSGVHPATVRRLAGLALMGLVLVGMVGCSAAEPQSIFGPASELATQIADLYAVIVWVAAGVFVIVEGVLIFAIVRYRARPGQGRPAQIHGNTRLEIAWTIAPALILAVIAVPTIGTIFRTYSGPPADALQIRVIGHQWWWEAQYVNEKVVTANEIHIPVGRPVALQLQSADVIHSFWVPKLAGKRDVVPGRTNELWFTPSEVGTFDGQCAEFCGVQHANMHVRVIVEPVAAYQAWVQSQLAPPVEPTSGSLAAQGQQIFKAAPCIACHTIQGVSQGNVGPNLTHVGSRTTIAAGTLDNTTANLRTWINNPADVKPGVVMPGHLLPDQNLDPVVAYLSSLK